MKTTDFSILRIGHTMNFESLKKKTCTKTQTKENDGKVGRRERGREIANEENNKHNVFDLAICWRLLSRAYTRSIRSSVEFQMKRKTISL